MPDTRFRRLRRTPALRALVRETRLSVDDLILPVFVEEGLDAPIEIASMPGVFRCPEKDLPKRLRRARKRGLKAFMLFGVSHHKDAEGSDTCRDDGLMARMIRAAKKAVPDAVIISDNCFCEYTTHGHCGVLSDGDVDNDATLARLQVQAVVAARAGADMIAPSGMMDGMIAAIRAALDAAGHTHIPVMSYSTKFASAFYGPFRDAVDSAFKGSRASYQMDVANGREALAESLQDDLEGADLLMVKPGMPCLDVLARLREVTTRPLAIYQVSGEYAMIRHAAAAGALDERAAVLESLLAFKRAGADLILSYFAEDVAAWLAD